MSEDLEALLVGVRGITYLMFFGREMDQNKVCKVLYREHLIKNRNVVRVYANDLARAGFLTKGKRLPLPGPPKLRQVESFLPFFETLSTYRVWRPYEGANKSFTQEEVQKMASFFTALSPFLDYFPRYLSLSLKIPKKQQYVRNLRWTQILKIFLEFCFGMTLCCWREHNLGPQMDHLTIHEKRTFLNDLAFAPMAYIRLASQRKKITPEDISKLADFSINGTDDIYHRTFLREIYLASISLRDPAAALSLVINTDDMTSDLIKGLLDNINVRAVNHAILEKAIEESFQIERELEQISEHKARDEMRHALLEADSTEKNIDSTLDAIIKRLNLDMTGAELMEALVKAELKSRLKMRVDELAPSLRVKKKNS